MAEDLKCPHCGTTKYRNPSLKLMVNVCGHGLCENCVELLFVKGSGSCPQCNCGLRRNNFRLQLFDDVFVEKEVDIRRRILKDFNKKEDDFETLREYNDYLEEIETIVYNLVNNIDVVSTNKLIESYKKENANLIIRNRGKLSKDEELIEELLEHEKEDSIVKNQYFINEEKEAKKTKTRLHEELVDELMFSDLPAHQILATHAIEHKQQLIPKEVINTSLKTSSDRQQTQTKVFSTGIRLGKGSNVFEPIPKKIEGVLYEYKSPHFDINGPNCPQLKSLKSSGYLNNVRSASNVELAGGFLPHYPCHRALQEAFCGLYFQPV
jgi:CDK-activating kinase assembly factor MAT1